jgi:hypothetical protein
MNNNIIQYLPTYKEDFKRDLRWVTKETSHYIFHYFTNSVAERDIKIIEDTQEKSFEKIISFLSVEKPKQKIEYYFYPSRETKIELMGDSGYAQAVFKDFTVHCLYTDEHKPIGEHEDTHLLSLPLGLATGFFAEGLAECLSWDRIVLGKTKTEWLKEGAGKILAVKKMVTHQDWMNTPNDTFMYYYSFTGFFVGKLIEQFGINTFKSFYQEINRDMKFEDINRVFVKFFKEDIVSYSKNLVVLS